MSLSLFDKMESQQNSYQQATGCQPLALPACYKPPSVHRTLEEAKLNSFWMLCINHLGFLDVWIWSSRKGSWRHQVEAQMGIHKKARKTTTFASFKISHVALRFLWGQFYLLLCGGYSDSPSASMNNHEHRHFLKGSFGEKSSSTEKQNQHYMQLL